MVTHNIESNKKMRSTWHQYMHESIQSNNLQDNYFDTNVKRETLVKSQKEKVEPENNFIKKYLSNQTE